MMFDVALRSAAILAAAWVLVRCLPRATAATRHLIWHAAFVAVLAAPVLSLVTPAITVAWMPDVNNVVERLSSPPAVSPDPTRASASQTITGPTGNDAVGLGGARTEVPRALLTLAAFIWIAVSATLLLWYGLGWVVAAVGARRADVAPPAWQVEANAWRARMVIASEVQVRLSTYETSPIAVGIWRPAVVFPASALTWDADRRRSVLLHELAHIRRADCRVQLIAQLACALYWFNPLVWMAAAGLRRERERACDDEVLRQGAQPSVYASHLLEIARALQAPLRPSAALAMARPSELEGRVLSVLASNRPRVAARGTRWAIGVGASLLTATVVMVSPVRSSPLAGTPQTRSRFVVVNEAMVQDEAVASRHDTVRPLVSALDDADADVREKAALALAVSSSHEAVAPLLRALTDRDAQVREKAAIGLALRRDERVIEPLLAAINDPDAQVREKVAIALGTSGDPRAAVALERALRDPDPQVREKAATGLMLLNTSVDEAQVARVRDGLRAVVGGLLALAR
jgi:beta-lactamase regulating signal transducer with metallopeptidase domain